MTEVAQADLPIPAQSVDFRKYLIPRQGWAGPDEHIKVTLLDAGENIQYCGRCIVLSTELCGASWRCFTVGFA